MTQVTSQALQKVRKGTASYDCRKLPGTAET